jgi:hypothetical protein
MKSREAEASGMPTANQLGRSGPRVGIKWKRAVRVVDKPLRWLGEQRAYREGMMRTWWRLLWAEGGRYERTCASWRDQPGPSSLELILRVGATHRGSVHERRIGVMSNPGGCRTPSPRGTSGAMSPSRDCGDGEGAANVMQ